MKRGERLINFNCPICKMKCNTSIFVIKEHLLREHPTEKVVMNKNGEFEKETVNEKKRFQKEE
jgi:hypothetical protein